MIIKKMYDGNLDDLLSISPEFSALRDLKPLEGTNRYWSRENQTSYSHDIQAIIIGKTGYGKSTTMNAILGKNIMASSSVEPCTQQVQSFEFKIRQHNYFSIADFPGIGETIEKDAGYLQLYRQMLFKTDLIIYLLRADMRDLSVDLEALDYLFHQHSNHRKNLFFALNFSDKIEPLSRNDSPVPSTEQLANIDTKIAELAHLLKPSSPIIPYSAATGWNMSVLKHAIVSKIASSEFVRQYNG